MTEVGTGKADITAFVKGVGMMGYGQHQQTVEEIETPLSARAFIFKDTESGKKVAFVNAEMCFITLAIKSGVIEKLKAEHPDLEFDNNNVMLTAQHTHSAPGGYSHYAFFNFSIPGFAPSVFNAIVKGITDAIVEANGNLQPAQIRVGKGEFDPEMEVAFNRSMKAYNANHDVEKLDKSQWHLALDRTMTLMRLDSTDGKPLGSINWFGVHTTTVGNDNRKICFDNKGYAAEFFENKMNVENADFLSVFAQAPCGDIMPNFIWERKRKKMRGKYKDDFESAQYNGQLQFDKAEEIFDKCGTNPPHENNNIDYGLMYVDFSDVVIDKEFIPENHPGKDKEQRTGHACMGVAFFKGTVDGRGLPDVLANITSCLAKTVKVSEHFNSLFYDEEKSAAIKHKYNTQGKKDILVETGERKILGTRNIKKLTPLTWVDPSLGTLKKHYDNGSLNNHPWTPQILPLQIFTFGNIAIVGVPGELTFIAGKRLKTTISEILSKKGIEEVIISPYANAYSGYITTFEEYQHQLYEGGHTVFGEWTHAAYLTKFKTLALEMLKEEAERDFDATTKPPEFSKEEIEKRSFPSSLSN